ncbi:type III-B CRISPR module RAMP protein Cmr6 [Myxococcota bacterium]
MTLHALAYAGQENAVRRLIDDRAGHAGLEWDRYLPLWEAEGGRVREIYASVAEFAGRANERRGQEPWLQECRERLRRATEAIARRRGLAVVSWEGMLIWRMATGLGTDHPTENGFSFDHATGLPVIPGTSVKGLCRAAAPLLDWETELIERLFGPEKVTAESPGRRGEAIFFDASPVSWPRLEVDIANSHHPEYYGNSGTASDADRRKKPKEPVETEDPNPVNFLTVAEGAQFLFSLLAPHEDKVRVHELLQSALRDVGIGVKTAVGYGRFIAGDRNDPARAPAPAASHGQPRKQHRPRVSERRRKRI